MDRITLEEAQKLAARGLNIVGEEYVNVLDCAGCVLTEDLTAFVMHPPFERSAMDGYACCSEDGKSASKEHPVTLSVAYKTCAGQRPGRRIRKGEAVRIMTGGIIPEGADCVLRQEDTDFGEQEVKFYASPVSGQNCCRAGEDFQVGDVLAEAGSTVDAYTIAAAVAAGRISMKVRKKVRAAVITTGDELWESGVPLESGKIYNSNMAYLQIRLMQLGCNMTFGRSTGDEREQIRNAVVDAAQTADLIITTGGVSVGQRDQVPHVMEELGAEVRFHGVAIKPGMPSMFSVWNGVPVLSLSGNPYSAFAVFELLMPSILSALLGRKQKTPVRIRTVAADAFPKFSKSRRILRGIFDGSRVHISLKQQNGQLVAGIGYNCLIDLPAGSEAVKAGDMVEAILIE